jgi:hypothetical protein
MAVPQANNPADLKASAAELSRVMNAFAGRLRELSLARTQLYREYNAALERKKIERLRQALGQSVQSPKQ